MADGRPAGETHVGGAIASGAEHKPREFLLPLTERVLQGSGALEAIATILDRYDAKAALLIAPRSLRESGLLEDLERCLGDRLAATFFDTEAHAPRRCILQASDTARRNGVDAIVSLGGGSQTDCAKAVALCLLQGITKEAGLDTYRVRFEYPDRLEVPSLVGKLGRLPLPIVAIPTTLSGAEFTSIFGLLDEARGVKDIFSGREFLPRAVILDPVVTAETPACLWASTGIKALDHAIEGTFSSKRFPLTDALAFGAIRALVGTLRRASADPGDIDARATCQVAAWMSIFGLANIGVGVSHALGHQLGARLGIPHGITSCITLPRAIAFNAPAVPDQLRRVGEAMGVETTASSESSIADGVIRELESLIEDLGLPSSLRESGVSRDLLPEIADHTLNDLVLQTNPRPVTREELVSLLESCW